MQKITPCLWFNYNGKEAVDFYLSVFKNSKMGYISYFGDEGPCPKGTPMVITFYINDQEYMILNGGPMYSFSPAISFLIHCDDQEEVDYYWEKLSEDARELNCGWVQDKFGVSWQVVPKQFMEMMQDKDPEKTKRVVAAMLNMNKLDINILKKAFDGE